MAIRACPCGECDHVVIDGGDCILCNTDNEGCPEHIEYDGDHIHEQHHSPEDHFGDDACLCPVYVE